MTRSLSGDLRGRVIAAIEDGVSTREAARRFPDRNLDGWGLVSPLSRDRRDGGHASRASRHARSSMRTRFSFSASSRRAPDVTLAEIGERLAVERGVRAAPSTVWLFLDRRGITFKKSRRTPQSSSAPMSCAAA